MAHFYTELSLNPSISLDAITEIIIEWVRGMKHSQLIKESTLIKKAENNEIKIESDIDSLHICKINCEIGDIIAAQYELREENGRNWTTHIVSSLFEYELFTSIRVTCDSINPEEHLPVPRKPHIIQMLLNQNMCSSDGEIQILNTPHILNGNDIDIATRIIQGKSTDTLPVVYVSASFGENKPEVDNERIARKLSGIAHVVVEPDRAFSNRLSISVSKRNAYGGAIGVYWPDSTRIKIYGLHHKQRTSEEFEKIIYSDIVRSLANRRCKPRHNWHFIREKISSRKIQELKNKNSNDTTEYCAAFDEENKSLRIRLSEAESEISRLTAKNKFNNTEYSDSTQYDEYSSIILSSKSEKDYFKDEIASIIIYSLEKCKNHINENTRKMHIINEIITSNWDLYRNAILESETIDGKIKKIFSNYSRMDNKIRRELNEMGFDISDEGKHYKIIYQGDERYTFSVAKTPSDHRAGKNLASDICKKIL